MIQVLLGYKADVNARNVNSLTPLHYISGLRGDRVFPQLLASVARVLLEHGADVNACDNQNSTALHGAVEMKRVEVVRALLKHGASVDAKDNIGKTPFQVAKDVDIIKLLSEHSAK
jgi:ankyrin repeat protein